MGKATQDLRKEHDAILHVLEIMDKMRANGTKEESTKLQYYKEVVYFLKIFADKCHHGKEENYFFEELVNNGVPNEDGPIGIMLKDHKQGREHIALMEKGLESGDLSQYQTSADKYRDLIKGHIKTENNILFVIADELLDEAKQEEIFKKFADFEESVIGHGVHEKLHSMIHQWAAEFAG